MDILKYYKEFLLIGNKLPKDLKRYIFSFVIEDFKNIIIDKKIEKMISRYKNNHKLRIQPTFHLGEIPYNYLLSKEKFKEKIDYFLNKEKIDVIFSHYCCSNKGICYCNPNAELNLTLFTPLTYNNNY